MTAPNIELAYNSDNPDDTSGLLSFLIEEERRSIDDALNAERAVALDFYNGEPFGDEEDGRSQYVTRDVAEVVDQTTTSLLGVMLSGDSAVEFDCQDKKLGKAITAAVGKEFFQGQDGYRVLHDWIKAGLLEKTSVAKVCVEKVPPKREERTVPVEALAMLMEEQAANPDGPKIIAAEPTDETEQQFRIAISVPQPPRFRDYVVPNEEMGIAQDARDLDEDCNYSAFWMPRTVSQIAEMGYDVSELMGDYDTSTNELSTARDGPDRSSSMVADYRTGPNRRVWLREEYARYDMDGDGITELLKVHRVGNTILNIEPIDEQPGVVWCPFPMPSRIVGQSLADKTMDIQRGRSMMFRQGLDNLYQSNSPRWALSESSIGDTTIDDLLTTARPGGIIRHVGAVPPMPVTIPFVAQAAFETAQVLAGEKESRTGITRLNQGLDPDALNLTASGTAMMMGAGQQMEDYQARNLAEAFARLMLKKYRLMRVWGQPMTVFVDGEEIEVNPKNWPEDAKVRVRVGLGTGRKDQRLGHRMNLLQIVAQARQDPEYGRMFTAENLYNQVAGVIEDSALGMVSEFISDPKKLPPAEPKQDPETLKVQADAMLQAEKLRQDQKTAEAQTALKVSQQQIDAQIKQRALDYDLQAKREAAALDTQLARDKAEFEAELATQKAQAEYDLALIRIENERKLAQAKTSQGDGISNDRPGGALNE